VSAVIACMHLKHNSCRMWPTPHPSLLSVWMLPGQSRQPITGLLATQPSNTAVVAVADHVHRVVLVQKGAGHSVC